MIKLPEGLVYILCSFSSLPSPKQIKKATYYTLSALSGLQKLYVKRLTNNLIKSRLFT